MTEKKPPLDLIVTRNGVPFEDQAEGVRAFKAACLKEEKPRDVAHAQSSAGSGPVTSSLHEALRPFAAVAAVDIGSDEADGDLFSPINHNHAPRLTVGDFRRALAALSAPAKPPAAPELTATCTKLLPGGGLDDSTYSQIEDALDAIDAPMTGDGGRYLTLVERIAAVARALPQKAMSEQGRNVWIVESEGIPFSVWLTERAATSLVDGYRQRGNRARWRVVPAILMSSMSSGSLKSAAEKALNYIENTENELGIKLSCGDGLREALK